MQPPVAYPPSIQQPIPWQRLNPIWWFQDITKPAGIPYFCRSDGWDSWAIRNKLHNLFGFVIGCEHKPHWFIGTASSDSIWNPAGGWNWGWCIGSIFALPLLSYRGRKWEWYIGWRPIGAFDITWRKSGAKSYQETHTEHA